MKIFDLLAGGLLLVSMLNGLLKGGSHEVVRVMSFVVAAAASLYLLRYSDPVFREMIGVHWMATAAAVLVVFAVIYIALRLLGASLTQPMQGGALGVLDRIVGLGFGLVRALALLGMTNLLLHAVTPGDHPPAWITGARLYPLTQASGRVLKVFLPRAEALGGKIGSGITSAVRQGATSDPNEGYSVRERRQPDD
jgi:membrane protein required for colicin V production